MRRASDLLPRAVFPVFVAQVLGFLSFCHSAQTVWLTPWRPAHGMKKQRRRRDVRRAAAARQDRAKGRRKEESGPDPESR